VIKIGKARVSAGNKRRSPSVTVSISYKGVARDCQVFDAADLDARFAFIDDKDRIDKGDWGFWTPSFGLTAGLVKVPDEDLAQLKAEVARGFAQLPKKQLTNAKLRVRACIRKLRPLLADLVRRGETLDSLEQELAAMCKEILVEAVQDA
jgi:hypothetical protein